jgi:cytosine/adenosine deaminase-related metal-dependent hydrolase
LAAVVIALAVAVGIALRQPTPLTVPMQGVALTGVTVVNPGLDRRADQVIAVEGPTIKTIADIGSPGAPPADARYRGAYVLPGLIDMHVHGLPPLGPPAALGGAYMFLMYLRYGVTTIRDTGNPGWMFDMRRRLLNGQIAGPRAFTGGPILDGDPPFRARISKVVRTPADADRVVEELAGQGADFIKVYERLTPEALHAIEAAARRHGLPVVGHVPELVRFEDAHIDDVQHLTGATDHPLRLYTSLPDLLLGTAKGWHDMDDARIAFVVRTSREQHVAHTPTLVVLDRMWRKDFDAQRSEPIARLMPAWFPDVFWQRSAGGLTPEQRSELRGYGTALTKQKLLVRRLHEGGVPLHLGTDVLNPYVVPGESLHEEMRAFLDCGFTPEEVWAAATRGNGAALPLADLGMLKPGAPADLLVFRDDPTTDLSKLDSLEAIVANGRLYTREDLDGAIARFRERFENPTYERTMATLVQMMPRPDTIAWPTPK